MSDPDQNDEELSALLRSWEVEGAPKHLDERMVEAYRSQVARPPWWRLLLAVPVRLPAPVAVAVAIVLLVLGYLAGRSTLRPGATPPAPALATAEAQVAGFPLVTRTQLAGFQPLEEVKVTILRKEEGHEE
jgi:hypothetical protein